MTIKELIDKLQEKLDSGEWHASMPVQLNYRDLRRLPLEYVHGQIEFRIIDVYSPQDNYEYNEDSTRN